MRNSRYASFEDLYGFDDEDDEDDEIELPEPEGSIIFRMIRGKETAIDILPRSERNQIIQELLNFVSNIRIAHRIINLFDLCCTYEGISLKNQ